MDDYWVKSAKLADLDPKTSTLLPLQIDLPMQIQQWGELQLDRDRRVLRYGSQSLKLSSCQSAILWLLLRDREPYYPHSLLLERLWSVSSPLQEAELQIEIQQLKEKLKSLGLDNLIETIHGIGYRLNLECLPTQSVSDTKQQQVQALIAKVWERAKPNVLEELVQIQKAIQALFEQVLDQDTQKSAEQKAHKLAGSLGTFGLLKGSDLAKKIETILESDISVVRQQMQYLKELVSDLHLLVEQTTAKSLADAKKQLSPSQLNERLNRSLYLLLVDAEPSVSLQIMAQAQAQGIKIAIASHVGNAKQLLVKGDYDAVLLQWQAIVNLDSAMDSLTELSYTLKHLGLMVFSRDLQLIEQLSASNLAIKGIFSPQTPTKLIIQFLKRLLQPDSSRSVKVLAVDDDPSVLQNLEILLEPWGLNLTTLDNVKHFWQTVETVTPEILILDLEMPQIDGLELCQELRQDPRWGWLPVLFLTSKNDPQTIERVFSVGADDYVSKPMVASELVTRILNRLERTQILRQRAEIDWLTGTASWYKSTLDLSYWFELADSASQPLSLVVLEVDYLKEVNQKYGHAVGDEILRSLGRLLREKLRSEDAISRWGGAEFTIGMYGVSQQAAIKKIADISADWLILLQKMALTEDNVRYLGTISVGVAQYPDDGITLPVLYQAARQSLIPA